MRHLMMMLTVMIPLFAQQSVQKAVFDCASDNMGYVGSRIWLIEASAKELRSKKVPYAFVLTVHSGCTPLIEQESDDAEIEQIQRLLASLHDEYGVEIEACEIALEHFGYEQEDLLPYIKTVQNSITRVIELQNSGYAFIPYH